MKILYGGDLGGEILFLYLTPGDEAEWTVISPGGAE